MGPDASPEMPGRTLPEALDVRRVSLGEARGAVATPDTVNVAAYVVEHSICPENVNCLLPDGIVIAESPHPSREDVYRISVNSPRQFEKGHRYLISIDVSNPPAQNLDENLLHLIGYSRWE